MSNEVEPPLSKYPALEKPQFKPMIPAFLTENASDQDKFIIESLSTLSQYVEWSVNTQLLVHDQVRRTNGRLMKAEEQIVDSQADVIGLKTQADAVSPFFKPVAMFSSLWEYRWFKWTFMLGIFVVLGLAYPYYVQHQFDTIKAVLKKMMGAD